MSQAVTAQPDPRFAQPRRLFFGVGAQKAATTWLDAYLRGHPEVCLPVRKEQHYWSSIRPTATPGRDRQARAARRVARVERQGLIKRLFRSSQKRAEDHSWMLAQEMLENARPGHGAYADALFQQWRGEPVAGEITPAYALCDTETFAEMAGLASDVRFVFVLRDPVDRLASGVRMNLAKGQGGAVQTGRFEDAMAAALDAPEGPGMLRSRYDLTVARLEAAVPTDRIAYFFYETLFRQEEIDRLTDFLGIARRPGDFARTVNARGGARGGLEPGLEARARAALRPVYEFVARRFGDQVPVGWRQLGAQAAMA